jgi:hypothetical protein
MTKLTNIEAQALRGILDSDYMDGDTGENAIDRPVWTWSANPFPKKVTFSGAVSSLVQKGFVWVQDMGTRDAVIAITQAGMEALVAKVED